MTLTFINVCSKEYIKNEKLTNIYSSFVFINIILYINTHTLMFVLIQLFAGSLICLHMNFFSRNGVCLLLKYCHYFLSSAGVTLTHAGVE